MAGGWLHGVCVSACWFVPPQCGFSLSLFGNYQRTNAPLPVVLRPLSAAMSLCCAICLHDCPASPLARPGLCRFAHITQLAATGLSHHATRLERRTLESSALPHGTMSSLDDHHFRRWSRFRQPFFSSDNTLHSRHAAAGACRRGLRLHQTSSALFVTVGDHAVGPPRRRQLMNHSAR